MKKSVLILTLPLILLASDNARDLYFKNACNSCHGMYAEGMGASPRLQGVREDILLRRLKDLQQGKARSAFGSIMISFAKALDENQTIEMAKYLSNLKKPENEDYYEREFDIAGGGTS